MRTRCTARPGLNAASVHLTASPRILTTESGTAVDLGVEPVRLADSSGQGQLGAPPCYLFGMSREVTHEFQALEGLIQLVVI